MRHLYFLMGAVVLIAEAVDLMASGTRQIHSDAPVCLAEGTVGVDLQVAEHNEPGCVSFWLGQVGGGGHFIRACPGRSDRHVVSVGPYIIFDECDDYYSAYLEGKFDVE